LVTVGGTLYGGAYGASTPNIYSLTPSGVATFVAGSPTTPSSPGVAGFWGLAPIGQDSTGAAIHVTFSSAIATFYQNNAGLSPSDMIDGIFVDPPGVNNIDVNGWSVFAGCHKGTAGGAHVRFSFLLEPLNNTGGRIGPRQIPPFSY